MSDKIEKVSNIILEIKNNSEPISGGSGDAERFQMQEPMLYWKLGRAILEVCEEHRIRVVDRIGWVKKYFREIDNRTWPGHEVSYYAYKYVHELVDEDVFVTVINLAGHKFKKFRRKRVDYILSAFAKQEPTATKKQQMELIEKLGEKDLSHDEFLKIKIEILKNTIPTDEIKDLFDQTYDNVDKALKNSEYRMTLRNDFGLQLITQLSYVLQLLKMSIDKVKLERALTKKIKNELDKNPKSGSKVAVQLFKYLRTCLLDSEKSKLLLRVIHVSEMNELNTNLFAIESEQNFEEYTKSREALAEIFKD